MTTKFATCPLCGHGAKVETTTLEQYWQLIKGVNHAKRATEIALAGQHSIGMIGHQQNYGIYILDTTTD